MKTMTIACLLLATLLLLSSSSAQRSPTTLVLPVSKDQGTNQYVAALRQKTPSTLLNLVVDLGARYSWVACEKGYNSSTFSYVPCSSPDCVGFLSKACSDSKICGTFPDNRYTRLATPGDLAQDSVTLRNTDGLPVTLPNVTFSCGGSSLLDGLVPVASGMVGLGRTPVALPSQLSSSLGFPNKFALCLPSTGSENGVIFFGEGPYRFLWGREFASASFVYTPLVVNPVPTYGVTFAGEPSFEYFVRVNAIKVNGNNVPVNASLLSINKKGKGGTKISTVYPYTALESSIYKSVVDAFARESSLRRVKPVAPFGACFDEKGVQSTRVGPTVPTIELVFGSGKASSSWLWYGANTMVRPRPGVLCLAFVDGDVDATTSIVVGGYQMDNNLLLFDLERKRLGVRATLLASQTSCSMFNFSVVP